LVPLPLYSFALSRSLSIIDVPETTDFRMKNFEIPASILVERDLGVVVSFGYFLPARVLDSFSMGCINLHPSLLPEFRGASPIQHALDRGDQKTGISIVDVEATSLDAGRLLLQTEVLIEPQDTYQTLSPRLSSLGGVALRSVVADLSHYRTRAVGQAGAVTRAPLLKADFGALNFQQPARAVVNRWRACFGFCNARTTYRALNVIVLDMKHIPSCETPSNLDHAAGSMMFDAVSQRLVVRCGDEECVSIGAVHLENKMKPVDARTFFMGHIEQRLKNGESIALGSTAA